MAINEVPPTITISGWRSVAAKAWASPSKKRPSGREEKPDVQKADEADVPASGDVKP